MSGEGGLTAEERDDVIRLVMEPDDSCAHNFAPLFAWLAARVAEAWDEGAAKASPYGGAYLRSLQAENPYRADRIEGAPAYSDGEREQRLVDDWETAFTFGVTLTAPGGGTWQWAGVDPRRATAIHRYLRMAGYRVVTEGIGGGTQARHGELGPS